MQLISVRESSQMLATVRPFCTLGALSAVRGAHAGTGQLPDPYREQYLQHVAEVGVTYTVVSCRTPIAWILRTGMIVIPEVAYSLTTSRHQNLCRAWLAAEV
jgi:hypothetical protein